MSVYSNFTKKQLQDMLLEAQNAYHELLTGSKAVKVNRAGRGVEYNNVNKGDLLNYIYELQNALTPNKNTRRAGRVIF